ncbi:PKD domain-containing protein [Tahibacter amnicola]|uniref:PKD domain-containing protein n=1 Tax=Tahibacter amnicola TaxID=2976241 RepID=A0ABY6B8G7_9GAMM|nr:PKD domain-containing protein [Tahibacter amnicola]UXI65857.1 PKD domain-containing protein [Tahibacter amnicola]
MNRYFRTAQAILAGMWLTALAQAQTTTQWPTGIGFPNIARTEGELIAPRFAGQDGRMAILAWHNGVLVSVPEAPDSAQGSNLQVRLWSLMNPAAPLRIVNAPADANGSLGLTPMPINAHGYLYLGQNMETGAAGPFLVIGADWPPSAPWSLRAQNGVPGVTREVSGTLGAGVRGDLFQPWFVGDTWWSYNPISGNATLRFGGNQFNPGSQLLATFDHLGTTGVIGHPFILGNRLFFASDMTRTGIASYDISNPANPVLLDVLKTGGAGGYWPEVWGNDGELYFVFPYNNEGNGVRIVDATDPGDMRFVADIPLPRPNGSAGAMYAQFQDEFAFIGEHKIDLRTRQSVRQFETITNDVEMTQFALPIGNLLVTGGSGGAHQGIAIFAHQAAPDTRPPSVAFHIPRAGQTNYPVGAPISLIIHETLDTLSIVNGTNLLLRRVLGPGSYGPALPGRWVLSFDDILTYTPDQPLQVDTTYEFSLSGIRDAAGNVMTPYAFTFSTGTNLGGNHPPQINALDATPYAVAPAATVSFAGVALDPDGDSLEYRYDFGDGTPKTAWGSTANADHVYAASGHYRATLQARDSSGVVASRTVTVTVLTPVAATVPTQSAPLTCHGPSRRVWAVNPDSDTVSAVNADTLAKVAEYATCADPRSIARTPQGHLWVTCHDADRVRVLNEDTGSTVAEIDTGYGSAPFAVALTPSGTTAFVSLFGKGVVRRYDTATRQMTGERTLGPGTRALAVSADGASVFVTRLLSPLHHAETWRVDASTMTVTDTLRIPKFGNDANRDTPASGRGVANTLTGIALSPRTGRAYVTANKPNSERGLLIHPSQDLDQDNTVRNLLVELDPAAANPASRFRRGIDLDNSDSASAVAFSPLADYLFVTLQGLNEVLVLDALALDASTGLGALVTRLGVGAAPQGLCLDAATERIFVQNFLGRSLSVIDAAGLLRRGELQLPTTEVDVVTTELLSPAVLSGKTHFYNATDPRMSSEGYLSCATCHLDGAEDGRVWDFTGRGEGLRNTVTLQGRSGTAHGNVHWSANFDEIQDFENDIRQFFGGSGFMSDTDYAQTQAPLGAAKAGRSVALDNLAAYVASLGVATLPRSPHRPADGSYSAAAVAGELIFAREGCTACHASPRYTDSTVGAGTLRQVGTIRATSGTRLGQPLTGIDTPGLRGVWATAPYFHDGSAATLDDVFRVTRGSILPAEAAQLAGGASLQSGFGVALNNDDSARGRAYAQVEGAGETITFTGVNGGAGGTGAIEIRYSNSRAGAQTQALAVRVNGQLLPGLALPASNNDPSWRATNWNVYRIENVPLTASATNTIELSTTNWYVSVDEILVATANDLAMALPHRRVQSLPAGERDALIAFLRELDGSPTPVGADTLFASGFEPL